MTGKEILFEILQIVRANNYSDIHLNTKHKPVVRDTSGNIITIENIGELSLPFLDKEMILDIIKELAGESLLDVFLKDLELDCSYKFTGGERYRINCYVDTNGYSISMRTIPSEIPTLKSLGFGDHVKELCNRSKGLILLTGPTGTGKSTNVAAMIDYINNNLKRHIITIEDPVEFSFTSNKSLINQREIGNSTKGFSQAIRACLREDPDVIVIGEMRDPETIQSALTLAETGHLVISTLHTNDSVQSVDRIVDVFPATSQKQIRMQLAMGLIGIISQRLLPRLDGKGRIAAREILVSNDAVRNLIISGKTHQLYGVLEMGQKSGMILMDKYLILLFNKGLISKEVLMGYIRDKDGIEMMLDQ